MQMDALAQNPRPDPTINPESGRDPRADGRFSECIPWIAEGATLPGTTPGGDPSPPTSKPGAIKKIWDWIKRVVF